MKKLLAVCCCWPLLALAQTDSTDTEDFSKYTDAAEVRRFATQKVLNLSASKLISVSYEFQGSNSVDVAPGADAAFSRFYQMKQAQGPRLLANFPIVSNDRIIVNLGGQYWGTAFSLQQPRGSISPAFPDGYFNDYMHHSMGITTSVFKPFNEKNFLIAQLGADFNAARPFSSGSSAKAVTVSGTVIYGWKTSERNMWGIGFSRTYRMGRLIHVPVLLWNKTFNDRWGMELILPAKGFVRRNISSRNLLLLGYELEGNQYLLPGLTGGAGNSTLFLQRGEIKPRLQWERQLKNFIWLTAQAGVRVNGRFVLTDRYAGNDQHEVFRTQLGVPFYFNIGINLVSP
ncbi:MAG: DUF6268 family outer membrane beta-barrel protein [Chitinophagaceae bacterium]|nr:DUF6268 family outer membrane beta-barrel protein [Chitinophagaceae bacterium]